MNTKEEALKLLQEVKFERLDYLYGFIVDDILKYGELTIGDVYEKLLQLDLWFYLRRDELLNRIADELKGPRRFSLYSEDNIVLTCDNIKTIRTCEGYQLKLKGSS